MKSMTASNYREFLLGDFKFYMEIKGYNHKFLEIKINLPNSLSFLEKDFREEIKKRINRGYVNFSLKTLNNTLDYIPRLNSSFIKEVLRSIEEITGKREDLEDWKVILSNPQVFILEPRSFSEDEILRIREEFVALLFDFDNERKREGEKIKISLEKCLENIESNLGKIEEEYENWKREIDNTIEKKLKEWNITIERERLLQEIALLLLKADINEEMERLKIFLEKFRGDITKEGSLGKNLEFLAQEMLRETNTLSSKASKTKIIEYALNIKGELERIRELISNIE